MNHDDAESSPRRLPDDISFERWVEYVFNHPVLDRHWWFLDEDDPLYEYWSELADPRRTLDYLTRLFSAPAFLIDRYSCAQIDEGLHFLVSNACSCHMSVMSDESLPWPARKRAIESKVTLYRDLMAPVYGDDLGHLDAVATPERPNFSCYMWWDVDSIWSDSDSPEDRRMRDTIFGVFEAVLALRSEACLESVLHGLGHWHLIAPERAEAIVRRFLHERHDISPALRAYAERAANGMVQ